MKKLIECVPNISEGKNRVIIDSIVSAAKVDGVTVLDVDPGEATNRTVITLVGTPEAIKTAAFNLIKKASELIDMSKHKGEHPRMGATDVCPFIPLQNTTMEDCIQCAKEVGEKVGKELGIPVFLYEEAASSEDRKSLAYLRQGEYEGLSAKFSDPKYKPDYGAAKFNPKSGATVIGARPFLIAYNINLNTTDKKKANKLAQIIRESGYKTKDSSGKSIHIPGKFSNCRAVGWYLEDFGIAQVSINLTNFKTTPMHAVFDEVEKLASEIGIRVTGSEIVGMVPKEAILASGKYYLEKQSKTKGIPEREIIHIAARSLGLSDLTLFNPKDKIIEEKLSIPKKLESLSIKEFCNVLSTDSPIPGGGSASALIGAMAASLCSMVSALTFGTCKNKSLAEELEKIGEESQIIKDKLLNSVDEDSSAFEEVMKAFRIKTNTPEEDNNKQAAIDNAYKIATQVPLEVAKSCFQITEYAKKLIEIGLSSAKSDAQVALQAASAGMKGAIYNVEINLEELRKRGTTQDFIKKIEEIIKSF